MGPTNQIITVIDLIGWVGLDGKMNDNKKGNLAQRLPFLFAGAAGFEPADVGSKGRCLTTWRRPNHKGPNVRILT